MSDCQHACPACCNILECLARQRLFRRLRPEQESLQETCCACCRSLVRPQDSWRMQSEGSTFVGEGDFPVGEFAELDTIVGIEKILKCEYFTVNIQTYHAADRHAAIVADTEAHVLPFHPHVFWVFGVDIKVVGFKVVFVTEVGAIAVAERVDKAIVARCCFALMWRGSFRQ